MASNKGKNRKKVRRHKPKIEASPMAGLIALVGRQTLSEDRARALSIPLYAAMVAMQTSGTEADYETIAVAMNFAAMLAEMGIGANGMQTFTRALELVYACSVRCEAAGVWCFTAEELDELNAAVELHDLQLTVCSQADLTLAQNRILAHVERGEVYSPA
jgi:hypothetical protein